MHITCNISFIYTPTQPPPTHYTTPAYTLHNPRLHTYKTPTYTWLHATYHTSTHIHLHTIKPPPTHYTTPVYTWKHATHTPTYYTTPPTHYTSPAYTLHNTRLHTYTTPAYTIHKPRLLTTTDRPTIEVGPLSFTRQSLSSTRTSALPSLLHNYIGTIPLHTPTHYTTPSYTLPLHTPTHYTSPAYLPQQIVLQ